ncbi:hypothetical protein D1872_337280 [compost metagenome]
MGVPPISYFIVEPEIIVADIQAAHKSDRSVHDDDFTMIAVVDATVQRGDQRRQKKIHLHPGLPQFPYKRTRQMVAAQPVANQTHL